jgi:replicative DNA helicase
VCELIRGHVRESEIIQAVRYWSIEHDYPKGLREDWIERTIGKAYDYLSQRTQPTQRKVMTIRDCMTSYVNSLDRGSLQCIPTGIDAFDGSVDGIRKGEVCVIAARPSAGKTAFTLQAMEHAASLGNPCLIISEEMDIDSIGERQMLRHAGGVNVADKQCVDVLREAAANSMPGYAPIYFTSYLSTIENIENTVDEYVRLFGVKLVAIDYLQCVTSKGGSRYEDTTDSSRRIKKMALRHGIGVYLVSQLNRAVEYRGTSKPQMSDLKESGGIEQDADTIVFLARDHPSSSQLKMWFAKRRNGKIRYPETVTTYNLDTQSFGGVTHWDDDNGIE